MAYGNDLERLGLARQGRGKRLRDPNFLEYDYLALLQHQQQVDEQMTYLQSAMIKTNAIARAKCVPAQSKFRGDQDQFQIFTAQCEMWRAG